MLVEWPPYLRLDCRQRRQVEQPAQFGRSAFGQAPFATMLSGVIRSGIQTGEGDERICALYGHTLEGVDQRGADDGADAGDRAQPSQVLLAFGTCFDQRLDPEVDARDELIEARS